MRIAYFDCHSGISGDMTLAALLDAGASLKSVQEVVHSMGLPEVSIRSEAATRKGFRGQHLVIEHPKEHAHRNLLDILALIRRATMSKNAAEIAHRLFERLARVEAKVHGTTIDQVYFHEVGAIDSIVDMVGVAVAWDELDIQKAVASPVPTGSGTVKISHGVVPLPAPATAELLRDIPIAPCGLPFEMTTPTGAVLLAELVSEYGPIPAMQVNRIGYGAGSREVPDRPNLLRILIGHAIPTRPASEDMDMVWVLETNLDDVSGERIGFAIEAAWRTGALDVFTTPIQMKKQRPGVMLTVLCRREDRQALESELFRHTGTLGIRVRKQARLVLPRASIGVGTPWGLVRGKVSKLPTGEVDFSPEYDDCCWIAKERCIRLQDVVEEVSRCYRAEESLQHEYPLPPEQQELPADSSLPSIASPTHPAASLNLELQQAAMEDQDRSATDRDTFYRWDSAPWPRDEDRDLP
ncbi:hypothetical protein VN12_17365 [Pirellula sp. SH-Sr6A]|uniref:nickel pincer cofactor biosynthesis protein LarC n=1 Tax=Pirellula sp. SH-Sr6A TaxID=1632865 RepID=UPI00078BA554|nr:nickel pincer cofactor biosynthesis protein LarC [Pirellula sp. SH-Sr6A]AMV33902.1 hypothetical protein VN12_17365 [Pirellula sp. SH-Sr6A]